LSLEDAIQIAHENNPEYRNQASALEVLPWREREVWGNFTPNASLVNSFGYTAGGERRFEDVTLGTQPAQLQSRYGLSLGLTITGSAFYLPGMVDAQGEATQAQVQGASASLIDQVTRGYLAALRADEVLTQARAEVDRTGAHVAQAEAQVAVGAATPLDIRRAEVQEGQAEVQLLQAENSVVTSRLALMRLLGAEMPSNVALSTTFEVFDPGLDPGQLLELALAQNPALRAARSQATVARRQTRVAQTQYFPTLSLAANWSGFISQADRIGPLVDSRLAQVSNQYEGCQQDNRILALLGDPARDCSIYDVSNPAIADAVRQQVRSANDGFPFDYDSQPLSLSASVQLPLFNGFTRELQVQEARVAEDNAQRQVAAEELRLRSEVETAVRTVETAQRTVELQGRIRETSAEELRLAQERFRLGLASSIEVVDAQTSLSDAERAEISAIYDFHDAFAALEALVGVSLRD
jgi:outer membrane protein